MKPSNDLNLNDKDLKIFSAELVALIRKCFESKLKGVQVYDFNKEYAAMISKWTRISLGYSKGGPGNSAP